jgi:hypothetical protein
VQTTSVPFDRAHVAQASFAPESGRQPVRIQIPPYDGPNPHVQKMMRFVGSQLSESVVGAYVHGSLATGEEIAYSDFDALVVIKDSVLRDPSQAATLRRNLSRAEQIMFEFDPLQHHGWFRLNEVDLEHYNEAFFPHELLAYSRSLMPDQGLELRIRPRESSTEARASFSEMVRNLQLGLQSGVLLRNMYHLKNTLSIFMLLPALYVQIRDGHGIFKKFSFEAARVDFKAEEWAPMDRVSEIRRMWRYEISPLRRWALSRAWRGRRHLVRRLAPGIPSAIREPITTELSRGMSTLASRMFSKLAI